MVWHDDQWRIWCEIDLAGPCSGCPWSSDLDRHADALATLAATYGRVFLSVAQR